MESLLTNLVDDIAEWIHKNRCNMDRVIKKWKYVKLNITIVRVFLNA